MAGGWWLVAGVRWLVAGGWWLVIGGWWLVAGGWWLVMVAGGFCSRRTDKKKREDWRLVNSPAIFHSFLAAIHRQIIEYQDEGRVETLFIHTLYFLVASSQRFPGSLLPGFMQIVD